MSAGEVPHNPFATQYVRPGAIPFVFGEGHSAEQVVARLQSQNWRGEIIGPHGSGKSTLLHALREPLRQAGRELIWFELKQGQHRLQAPSAEKSTVPTNTRWNKNTLVIVDGAEQLTWLRRKSLLARTQWRGAGLLWTTHRPLELRPVWETKTDLRLAETIVRRLVPDDDHRIAPEEIEVAFKASNQNLRETLFQLFDRYQRKL